MQEIISTQYKSSDGNTFYSKEECELYEKTYLTDKQLQDCFHFFHKKVENYGRTDVNNKYERRTVYKFVIVRKPDSQEIYLHCDHISDSIHKSYEENTGAGFIIYNNFDFIVLQKCHNVDGSITFHKESTYNIKAFYKFLEELRFLEEIKLF